MLELDGPWRSASSSPKGLASRSAFRLAFHLRVRCLRVRRPLVRRPLVRRPLVRRPLV